MNAISHQAATVAALFADLQARGLDLGPRPYAVNIGANDGVSADDPCFPLYEAGWAGVAIEGQDLPTLADNLAPFDVEVMAGTYVYPENIAALLRRAGCPDRPEFLKIDIDGFDGEVLEAVLAAGFRPSVIQAEINPEIPPPYAFCVGSSPVVRPGANHGFYGFSVQWGEDMLARYGYRLLQVTIDPPFTHDAVFIDGDLADRIGVATTTAAVAFFERPAFLPHLGNWAIEDRLAWRTRTDIGAVRYDIWRAMMEASRRKHGHHDAPFSLSISQAASYSMLTRRT